MSTISFSELTELPPHWVVSIPLQKAVDYNQKESVVQYVHEISPCDVEEEPHDCAVLMQNTVIPFHIVDCAITTNSLSFLLNANASEIVRLPVNKPIRRNAHRSTEFCIIGGVLE